MKYKDLFENELSIKLSPKKCLNYKIELIFTGTQTCKVIYCLAPNKLKECKAQMK